MNPRKDWWKDFFQGLTLDLWRAVITEERNTEEANFIEKQLQVARGAKLLDAPCGAGRLTLELAARGYRMTGIDLAADFIREARAASLARQLAIDWHEGNVIELAWREEFDGAFCVGNSFGYFEDEENEAFLAGLAAALKPGARLLMDTTAAEAILPHFQERGWFEAGGVLMLEENRYDAEGGRYNTEYTFMREGRRETRTGSQRLYTFRELARLLEAAGFEETRGYGSTALEPFGLGSQRLLVMTRKRKTGI